MARTINIPDPTAEESLAALQGRVNITSFDVESVVHGQDAEWSYRWVNKKQARVDHLKVIGWRVVGHDDGARGGVWNEGAGAWMANGDRILMKCRRDVFEARKEHQRSRFERLTKDAKEQFHIDGYKLGVKTFEETNEQE